MHDGDYGNDCHDNNSEEQTDERRSAERVLGQQAVSCRCEAGNDSGRLACSENDLVTASSRNVWARGCLAMCSSYTVKR